MRTKLWLLFLIVPLVEIALFIEIGSRIGTGTTLLSLALMAVLGATLAQREGLKTWWRIQDKVSKGLMPGEELLDGMMILVAGVLLLTPGFFTDAIGLFLLFPGTRRVTKRWLRSALRRRLQGQGGAWRFNSHSSPYNGQ
jgi:UPF0716 protein FxsA